jgi:hypothetical protein
MNYLERLDIHPNVQSFFKNHLTISCETLVFKYGDSIEHASPEFHKIPLTETCWVAGDPFLAKDIIIAASAMDAITWLNLNHSRYNGLQALCFIAIGSVPQQAQAALLKKYAPKRKLRFVFSKDDLGALSDLKLASFIRDKPLKIRFQENHYQIKFEHKTYAFERLSLNALEKASGYNFHIRTHKPKNANTFYEQLRNRHPA